MARRFDRSRLRSETAKRIYDKFYGQEETTKEQEDENKYKMLIEKRRAFNLWLLDAGKTVEEASEEDIRAFQEGRAPDYAAGKPAPVLEEKEETSVATSTIDSKLDPMLDEEPEDEGATAVEESVEVADKEETESSAPSTGGNDFLEDLKKQYSDPTGQDASQGDQAGASAGTATAPQQTDLSDKATAQGTGNNNGSTQGTTKTPSFVKTGQGPLTSKVPQITMEEFLTYFQDNGVVGEEKNLLRFGFRLSQLKPTFVDGKAGSGKTHIIKAGLTMLPKDYVLTVDCASDTSLFIDDDVEKYPIIWFKEFQKVAYKSGGNNQLLEMIKSWAEGEEAKRRVNDHGKLKFQTISEKCVISCLATENAKKGKFDRDKETLRRFDILHTDETQEHVQKVMEYKAKLRTMNSQPKKLSQLKADQVKKHFRELVDIALDKDNELRVSNPFAESIKEYIPETPRAISYMDMYYDYVEGCTKFHYKNRLGEDNLLISDLQDQYIIHRIYHNDFCDMLQKLDDLSEEEFEKRAKKSKDPVDWKAVLEAGYETVKACFSEEVAEEWVTRQLIDNKITVWDPISKKDVVIVDYNNPTPSSQAPKQYQHQTLPQDQGQQSSSSQDASQGTGDPDSQAYTPQVKPEDLGTEEVKDADVNVEPVDEISLDE